MGNPFYERVRACWIPFNAWLVEVSVLRDAHDQFAEVPAFQQSDEGFGRVLQSINNVFAVLDAAFVKPGAHLLVELPIAVAVVVEN